MGRSFLESEVSAGGRIGAEHIEGVELGSKLPLVLTVDIGLSVGHDAGDRLAGGGLPDPGLPAVQGEAVLPDDPGDRLKKSGFRRPFSRKGEVIGIAGVGVSVLPGEKGQTGIHPQADKVGNDGRQRRPRGQRMAVSAQQGQRRGQIRVEMKGRPQEELPHHGGFHRREKAEQVHTDDILLPDMRKGVGHDVPRTHSIGRTTDKSVHFRGHEIIVDGLKVPVQRPLDLLQPETGNVKDPRFPRRSRDDLPPVAGIKDHPAELIVRHPQQRGKLGGTFALQEATAEFFLCGEGIIGSHGSDCCFLSKVCMV